MITQNEDVVLCVQHPCEMGIVFILKKEKNECHLSQGHVTGIQAQVCVTPALVLSASAGMTVSFTCHSDCMRAVLRFVSCVFVSD